MSDCHSTTASPESDELLPVYRELGFTHTELAEFLNSLSREYKEISGRKRKTITYVALRKGIVKVLKRPEKLPAEWAETSPHFKAMIDAVLPGDCGDVLIIEGRYGELLDAFKQSEIEYAEPPCLPNRRTGKQQKASYLLVSRIMAKFIRRAGRLPTIDGRTDTDGNGSLAPSALFETFLRAIYADLSDLFGLDLPKADSLVMSAKRQIRENLKPPQII